MARDFARVSAIDGIMWFGLVHCRRSFLRQRCEACMRVRARCLMMRAGGGCSVCGGNDDDDYAGDNDDHDLSHAPQPSEKRPLASNARTVKSARDTSPLSS